MNFLRHYNVPKNYFDVYKTSYVVMAGLLRVKM